MREKEREGNAREAQGNIARVGNSFKLPRAVARCRNLRQSTARESLCPD